MKTRKIGIFTQLFILLAVLLLIGNSTLGYLSYMRSEDVLFKQIQTNAKNIAQCTAQNVSGDLLNMINVGEEDSRKYAIIIEELALFRDNADVEYIYTLRKTGDNQFIFVVDSDPEEPASIGDVCESTDALNETFSKQITTADEEAFEDEWGTHISAYSPILDKDTVVGAVGVDISANWIEEQMQGLRNLVFITFAATYITSVFVLLLIMNRFKKSMIKLNDKVLELASGSGDLTKEIDIYSGDELEVIAGNMNVFLGQIRSLVKDVAHSSESILKTGEELNNTIFHNNKVMSSMNTKIEDISNNMRHSADSSQVLSQSLAESAEHISDFAKDVDELCKIVQKSNENAQASSLMAKENRRNAIESIQVLQKRMHEASKDVQKIEQVKQIASQIGDIASQTKMLSLNAQIEAARAGTMGAGFAVVATEVGHLSNDIDKSVSDINQINAQVLSAVSTLNEVLNEMIDFVSTDIVKDYDSFVSLGDEYGTTTDTIRAQMMEIGNQSTDISRNIADISTNVQEITSIVTLTADSANELTVSTNEIAESFESLSAASERNSDYSENLSEQVRKYKF